MNVSHATVFGFSNLTPDTQISSSRRTRIAAAAVGYAKQEAGGLVAPVAAAMQLGEHALPQVRPAAEAVARRREGPYNRLD